MIRPVFLVQYTLGCPEEKPANYGSLHACFAGITRGKKSDCFVLPAVTPEEECHSPLAGMGTDGWSNVVNLHLAI